MYNKMLDSARELFLNTKSTLERGLMTEWFKLLGVNNGEPHAIAYDVFRKEISKAYDDFGKVAKFVRAGMKEDMPPKEHVPFQIRDVRESYETFINQIDFAETYFANLPK